MTKGKDRPARANAPLAADFKVDALPLPPILGDEFAKGEDVGHGVDHDCAQCRNARRTLSEAGMSGLTEGRAPLDQGSDYFEGEGQPSAPGTDLTAFHEAADHNSRALDDMMSGRGADVKDFTTMPLRSPEPLPFADETQFVRDTRSEMLDGILDRLLQTAMENYGLHLSAAVVGIDEFGDFHLIDDLMQAMPGMGVMIMKGYVPDDDRWHVELVHGVSRAHVKHRERDVAIKVAALTLFNGEKGAEVERRYHEIEQANAAAKAAAPGAWTGQTQAGA